QQDRRASVVLTGRPPDFRGHHVCAPERFRGIVEVLGGQARNRTCRSLRETRQRAAPGQRISTFENFPASKPVRRGQLEFSEPDTIKDELRYGFFAPNKPKKTADRVRGEWLGSLT